MNFVASLRNRIVVCLFAPVKTVTMPFVVRGGIDPRELPSERGFHSLNKVCCFTISSPLS